MNFKIEDAALVTHKNCMDGSGCATLFVALGGNIDNVFFTQPGTDEVDELVKELYENHEGDILIADVSVSVEMAEFISNRKDITLIDHHKTALRLSKFSWCHIDKDNDQCACSLVFDFFKSLYFQDHEKKLILESYRELIQLIDDRDRFLNNFKESAQLQYLHDLYRQHRFINRFLEDPNSELSKTEKVILEIEDEKRKEYVNAKLKEVEFFEVDNTPNFEPGGPIFDVYYFPSKMAVVLCDPQYRNDVGQAVYEKHPDVSLVFLVSNDYISIRAPKNTTWDASKIASWYGGGGHRCAAGLNTGNLLDVKFTTLIKEKLYNDFYNKR